MGSRIIENLNENPDATLIEPDDFKSLIPEINSRKELDQFEAENINQAYSWAYKSRKLKRELISTSGLRLLHQKMFEQVWSWAGKYRKTQKNIGVEAHSIQEEIHKLAADINYLLKNQTYPIREIAVRFQHRLVWIHPFENGNGRHARATADLFLRYHNLDSLYWPEMSDIENFRVEYIQALKNADRGEYKDLFNLLRV